jgi:hypothetical protein
MRFLSLLLSFALLFILPACSEYVDSKSVETPAEQRYSSQRQEIRLRPNKTAISVPTNELWYVHTNPVSRGWPKNEPYVGKAWDRVEVRFALLPDIRQRTPDTEAVFNESGGDRLLIITLMQPMGSDGDTRTAWKIVRLEPTGQASPVVYEAAKAAGAYPAPLVAQHLELDLDEYEGKDEYGSRFFKKDNTIVRCWRRPLSTIRHVCESSFNMENGLLVNVEFSYESLPRWKELLAFAKMRTATYIEK